MTTIRNMMAVSVAAMLGLAGGVSAQSFPDKPITMIVPFAAGTSTDTVSRLIAERMSEDLGQTVVVENRAGAGGSVGTQDVVSSDADGYTIAMGTVGTLAINKSIFPELPYDPESDVTPIAFVGYTPTLLVVSAESNFQTLGDLVEAAKSEDGVTFASTGNGTSTHLAGELLKTLSDTNMIHVPFGSGAVGLAAVMSGEVDFMFNHPVSAKQNMDAGKLRALGVSGAAGSEVAPEVPPINDSYDGFDLIAWWLMHGPADMPADVTERLNAAVTSALASDAVSAHFVTSGISKGDVPFAELDNFISSEVKKWGDIANAANAQAN